MRYILIYTFLLLVCLTSCQTTPKDVVIKGKFIGQIPNELLYSNPINGICYQAFHESVEVDSLGNFEIIININEPSFISLYLKGKNCQLIAEPGESYQITIEAVDGENIISYDCKNKLIQEEYQKLSNPRSPAYVVYEYKDLPFSDVDNKLDSLYLNDISIFKVQHDAGTLPLTILEKIKLDRKLLYSAALHFYAAINFSYSLDKGLEAKVDSTRVIWNDIILKNQFNAEKLLKSKWAFSYIQYFLEYHEYTAVDFTFDMRKEARKEGNIHTYMLTIAQKFLDPNLLEFYTASYIKHKTFQNKFEEELVALFNAFESDFPTSKYTKYIKPKIDKIVNFHKEVSVDFRKEHKFVDNYQNLNSLGECLLPFKGSKVYVDLWATFCGPCKKQFEYNLKLKKLLEDKGVEMLYISTDSDPYQKRWKNMIKYYDLQGNHIRANADLKADLRAKLGRYGIPRYLIIDENGNLVNDNAPQPSDLEELEKLL